MNTRVKLIYLYTQHVGMKTPLWYPICICICICTEKDHCICWYLFLIKTLISMKSFNPDILFASISMVRVHVVCMPILHVHVLIFDMHMCWYLTCSDISDIIHVDIFYHGFLTCIETIWYILISITLILGMHWCLIIWNLTCIDSFYFKTWHVFISGINWYDTGLDLKKHITYP